MAIKKITFRFVDLLNNPEYLILFLVLIHSYSFSVFCLKQNNDSYSETRVKAAYIYNFTKFVYWNDELNDSDIREINILIFGSDTILRVLETEFAKKSINTCQVKIKKVQWEITDMEDCQVFYVGRSQVQRLPALLKLFKGRNILTVSDIPGFAQSGGMIGFFKKEGRVKIEVNMNTIRKAGLKINAKLLDVAKVITDEE